MLGQSQSYIFGNSWTQFIMGASWLSPILKIGYQRPIKQEQIPDLKTSDTTQYNFRKFQQIFQHQRKNNLSQHSGITLFRTIIQFYKKQTLMFLLLCLSLIGAEVYIPLYSRNVILYMDNPQEHSTKQNILYLVQFCGLYFIYMFLITFYYHVNKIKGVNLANILSLMVYRKILGYPLIALKKIENAEIINYSQMNCRNLQMLSVNLKHLIIFVGQIIANYIFLYLNIGALTVVLAAFLMLTFCIGFFCIYYLMKNLGEELYEAKDKTVGMAQQIIQMIKFIKINVLQRQFLQKISKTRQNELKIKIKICLLKALCKFLSCISSPTIIIVIFFAHILLGNDLNSANAYFIIMIFINFQAQMNFFEHDISSLSQLIVATKRIESFLLEEQIDNSAIQYKQSTKTSLTQFAVQIENGNYLWERHTKKEQEKKDRQLLVDFNQISNEKNIMEEVILNERDYIRIFSNLNLFFRANQLTMIIGQTGSGKSSLVYSILNQMISDPNVNSKIKVGGSIAYCSQKPWIMTSNIRDNIVFFQQYNERRLNEAIYYSCLTNDVNIFQDGLDTEIGENATNLSGGQRARISLARALYSNKDIYILDDILSALDINVSEFIMSNTIKGYLKGKTIIMPTHAVNFLDRADQIVRINKGQYQYLNKTQCQEFIRKQSVKQKQNGQKASIGKQNVSQPTYQKKVIQQCINNNTKIIDSLQLPEEQLPGISKTQTYLHYIELTGGKFFVILLVILMLLSTILYFLSNIQIQQLEVNKDMAEKTGYLYKYLLYSIYYSVFMVISNFIFSFGLIRSARMIYKSVMKALVYANYINFYCRVPKGRIINRLSNDMEQMDAIPQLLQSSTAGLLTILANFTLTVYATTPFVILPITIVIIISGFIYVYFVKSLFSAVRLSKISMSPLVSGLTDIINGVDTIRSYHLEQEFINIQIKKSDGYARMAYTQTSLFYWMMFRVSFIIIIFSAIIFAYCMFSGKEGAQLGLFLAFSMNFVHQLIELTYFFSQVLVKMVSTERLFDLNNLQPEKGYKQIDKQIVYQVLQTQILPKEAIKLVNFSARYQQNLPFSLRNLSLQILKGTKVGIVGRTGSGKTTLINCLLGFVQNIEGSLYIQGKEIRDYDVRQLRSSMTIIQQNPWVINDTLRQNLDPSHLYTDDEIYGVMKKCKFDIRFQKRGGLQAQLSNNGLSVGQKQLVCICRALLKKSPIILIDEATANIDNQNDNVVQEAMKSSFHDQTVLIIAHRLSILEHCSKILLLQAGQAIEWGSPNQLLKNPKSRYRKMWESHHKSY